MLHEIAASDLEITNIVNPLRKLLHKVEVLVGDVDQIDLAAKRVLISRNSRNYPQQIGYDHLVIALGSVTNFYNLAGCTEFGPADEIAFGRNSIARTNSAPFGRGELRMFVRPIDSHYLLLSWPGGGFAGVETVAALNDFVREALPFYPRLREEMLRVILVHSGPVILPELGEGSRTIHPEGAHTTRRRNSTEHPSQGHDGRGTYP